MLTAQEQKFISLAPFDVPALFDIHLENNLPLINTYGRLQTYAKGHIFFHPEEKVETIHFLTKGLIAESTSNANGLEKLTLVFPYYPQALAAALHQQPIIYTAYAYTDVTVISLPMGRLLELMQTNRPLLENILRLLALETRNANNLILQNYSSSTIEKIYQTLYFYYLTAKHYEPLRSVKLSQQLIAGLSGVHRTSVNTALKTLKEQHIITLDKKVLTVLDPPALKELAFVEMD